MKSEFSAGGIIFRRSGQALEVLIILDMNASWTFPKGMIEKHEETEETARREIAEEVGLTNLTFMGALPPITYTFKRKSTIQKTVQYYVYMYTGSETLVPQKEEGISEAKWVTFEEALVSVGYRDTNPDLLKQAKAMLDGAVA